jgi:tetratricopeptide (TPR) repeat protein
VDLIRLSSSEFQNQDLHPEIVENRPGRALDLEDLYIILQSHPHDSEIALQLANRLKKSGRLSEAIGVLRNALKIDNGFVTLSTLAHAEYENGEDEAALLHYQAAILVASEDSPELFEIFKNLGNIYVRRGDLDSAEDNYNRAHRIQASSDVLFVNMGTLCVQRQAWDEALEKFRAALVLNMFNDKAWVGLAIGHRMKSDRELAWGNLEAALEYNPLNEAALTLALEWGSQEGRESRVLEMIRTFLIEGGWNEKMSLAFCWLSWRRGDRMIAEIELERLLAVNPQHENALKLLHEMRASA